MGIAFDATFAALPPPPSPDPGRPAGRSRNPSPHHHWYSRRHSSATQDQAHLPEVVRAVRTRRMTSAPPSTSPAEPILEAVNVLPVNLMHKAKAGNIETQIDERTRALDLIPQPVTVKLFSRPLAISEMEREGRYSIGTAASTPATCSFSRPSGPSPLSRRRRLANPGFRAEFQGSLTCGTYRSSSPAMASIRLTVISGLMAYLPGGCELQWRRDRPSGPVTRRWPRTWCTGPSCVCATLPTCCVSPEAAISSLPTSSATQTAATAAADPITTIVALSTLPVAGGPDHPLGPRRRPGGAGQG